MPFSWSFTQAFIAIMVRTGLMTRTGDEPVGVLYERSLTGDPDSDASW